jgi:hypothetical protein
MRSSECIFSPQHCECVLISYSRMTLMEGQFMSRAINEEKIRSIRMWGLGTGFIILMACVAGCTSVPPATTPAPEAAITVTPGVPDSAPLTITPMDTLSPPTTGLTAHTTPAGQTAAPPVNSDPIIGTWGFTNAEGSLVTLVFSKDGTFSGTIDGKQSPTGIWKAIKEHQYQVTLSSGESWNYVYELGYDTIYDVSDPSITIIRK